MRLTGPYGHSGQWPWHPSIQPCDNIRYNGFHAIDVQDSRRRIHAGIVIVRLLVGRVLRRLDDALVWLLDSAAGYGGSGRDGLAGSWLAGGGAAVVDRAGSDRRGHRGHRLRSLSIAVCAGGAPLFTVFGKFGNMLLGVGKDDQPSSLALVLGWSYHFSNGAALGIMFLAMIVRPSPRLLFWGAVAWALCVEAILLMTPYASIFGLELNAWFIFLTASAHAIFGVVLGLWARWRLMRQARVVVVQ